MLGLHVKNMFFSDVQDMIWLINCLRITLLKENSDKWHLVGGPALENETNESKSETNKQTNKMAEYLEEWYKYFQGFSVYEIT